jgi:hypothetical protein
MINKTSILQFLKTKINIILVNFTLAKFIAALITIIFVALIKYYLSGGFKIDNLDIINNIAIGLLSWTINTSMIGWLTDYLGIKGINFNINQFIFGFNTLKIGAEPVYLNKLNKITNKLYNAMESDNDSDSSHTTIKPLDKGKGIDRSIDESQSKPISKEVDWREAEINRINKWKSINWAEIRAKSITDTEAISLNKDKGIEDPLFSFLPKRTNPGPGFNVPGGEVPIKDDICKHINYNPYILSQYRNMDLETAIQQRDTYFLHLKVLHNKFMYAQDALTKVPTIPATEFDFKLRNKILSDLEAMNRDKISLEARATLIKSRVEFIENEINKN